MSITRQTTTAATSIGFPIASLTFRVSDSKLRSRRLYDGFAVSGTVQTKPVRRIVPAYRPRKMTTRAMFGSIWVKPDAITTPATVSADPATMSHSFTDDSVNAEMNARAARAKMATSRTRIPQPETDSAPRSFT